MACVELAVSATRTRNMQPMKIPMGVGPTTPAAITMAAVRITTHSMK
jgi:hypothetical protein